VLEACARIEDFSRPLDLRRLAVSAGWAQSYAVGGGADEYQGVFCAVDPAVTARFSELARGIDPVEGDRRRGRL
jgi:hypothetical protein